MSNRSSSELARPGDSARVIARQSEAPPLPERAQSRSGASFDPRSDLWAWRDSVVSVSMSFEPMRQYMSARLLDSLKLTLIWYVRVHSPRTAMANRAAFWHFLKATHKQGSAPLDQIKSVDVLNYKASLRPSFEHYLGRLATVLRRWRRLGYPGVGDAVSLLNDMRLAGGVKGAAVMTMCPIMGPFTNTEQEAIQSAVDEAYVDGEIEAIHYLLTWLLMALGQRPEQYAAMKVCDIARTIEEDGTHLYALRVPRAKQSENPRTSFKERLLIPQIGRPLWDYAQHVRERFSDLLSDSSQAPMFPQKVVGEMAPGFEYHYTTGAMTSSLKIVLKKLDVTSERTGEPLHITPIRFRRTFGTRAAQEGHGELVIAELLDHSDTQNVGVYVAAVPEIAARIDRAIAMELAPLAQAFKGMVIDDEPAATRGSDPASRIRDLRIDREGRPMGSCGQFSACGYAKPIACYTCRSFEPWLDGPHEAVLNYLLAKREQNSSSLGPRMASINDRTILAVAEVVQLCRTTIDGRAAIHG